MPHLLAANSSFLIRLLTTLAVSVACLASCAVIHAEEDGQALFLDLHDRSLDQFSLLEAALLIGGFDHASSSAVPRHLSDRILTDKAEGSTRNRIQQILSGMHTAVMTGQYDSNATQLPTMLATGNYNCVSSATLFMGLAEISHVATRGVLRPGHLACRAWIPEEGQWIDVEPTQATLDGRHEAATGRELTPAQVLAKLYYNRGIELLAEQDYWPAMRCAQLGVELDPAHAEAKDSLTAVVGQWAFALCQQQRFEDAIYVLAQGHRMLPQRPQLSAHEIHVYALWVRDLVRRGQIAAAELQLARALQSHPESDLLRNSATVLRGPAHLP